MFQRLAPQGPPVQKLVWIASLVRLNRPLFGHFARTLLLRKQERQPIAELAAVCQYARFKSDRQCWVRRTLPVAISSVARRLIFFVGLPTICLLTFSSLNVKSGLFDHPFGEGLWGTWGSGISPFDSSPTGSY